MTTDGESRKAFPAGHAHYGTIKGRIFFGYFEIYGYVNIPTQNRLISEDLTSFWEENELIADRIGCYVFAIKTGRSIVPYYVGLTTKSFISECFTDHKLKHYHYTINEYDRGKPVMFFVLHPKAKGRPNIKEIEEVENFLIQVGVAVNPNIRNIRSTKQPTWSIKGVVKSGQGNISNDAKLFKKMMGI